MSSNPEVTSRDTAVKAQLEKINGVMLNLGRRFLVCLERLSIDGDSRGRSRVLLELGKVSAPLS